ncbi:rhamnogalacturonate lyase B isoform X1 [Tripterygium wilfordii]|uniref:rhamnogalacturonan endolyase n=1 Tax=Tripterygium wilfordii TaxID=458696 RepID=A0A7J7CVC5_TRIWF|nr:rhamnogalacturonate lyase B-like [Tripterygium wilfordii]KAF5738047.1 rhamnogalacturonate lyase B isoform X1 [Tripterygium wilfordii]
MNMEMLEMKKEKKKGRCLAIMVVVAMELLFLFSASSAEPTTSPFRKLLLGDLKESKTKASPSTVSLLREYEHEDGKIIVDNGILQVTISIPDGFVTGINYNGIDNLLATQNEKNNRGYWDVVWEEPGNHDIFDKLATTDFRVIVEDEDQVEVSFTKTWNISHHDSYTVPLHIDKRYILRRGVSGLYAYTIMEREQGWPEVEMYQTRIVFKLRDDLFKFMALSDQRQRVMPAPEDRESGQPLAYPEAVLLTSATNPRLRGEVDDKYQYSCEDKDNRVHGWISNADPSVGFWMITPSNEFRNGGPIKQDLTSHVGPTVLNMFVSTHYAGEDLDTHYSSEEPWKKVFGPVLIYLNSQPNNNSSLWEDAKKQMLTEVQNWPYDFPRSEDFPTSLQRGSITGRLLVVDRYAHYNMTWTKSAYVGLAAPGESGSWQTESKGYQFWTKTDSKGKFLIKNVRVGNYSLYAWVPGVIGDYKFDPLISINPGEEIKLDVIKYHPPRAGPTLWEIGYPDRSAEEFYVPDPYPTLMNRLYTQVRAEKFRQYGLWERYSDLYSTQDLIYTVGLDNYQKDWYFAHNSRNVGNNTYAATTWQIKFDLVHNPDQTGNYTMQLALAAANGAEIQVRFNNGVADQPHFTTGLVGKDNAIARHGIHGLYHLYTIGVPSDLLNNGGNTIFLTQTRTRSPFFGVMYDYIRLEGPPQP